MQLEQYLHRIGFKGRPQVDLDTLKRLHRGHVLNIPYENLDVQFGRPVSRDEKLIFEKLVPGGRGGWCYEMNGLLAWSLERIGFRITRLAGGVGRSEIGDRAIGNHLVVLVHLDQDFVADVGFGDGLLEPIPLESGQYKQGPSCFQLEALDSAWWRFHGDVRSRGLSFDFQAEPADQRLLDAQCERLQTSPDSVFVQNAVVQRHLDGTHAALRGCVLRYAGRRNETIELKSAAEHVSVLEDVFGLRLPEAGRLWPAIRARHEQLFPNGLGN